MVHTSQQCQGSIYALTFVYGATVSQHQPQLIVSEGYMGIVQMVSYMFILETRNLRSRSYNNCKTAINCCRDCKASDGYHCSYLTSIAPSTRLSVLYDPMGDRMPRLLLSSKEKNEIPDTICAFSLYRTPSK
ncbi:hypothetical protein PROFUN_07529 [Planoprotostelium fungivorum]|uniref:Uncharacterized protein n=1 Tax=Planoprotostelium fungivorum TaxID=1890364 RepID=A0A2P6NLM5_9EUKA|nr:hypothetical protein PROFUN_07529 [Planoprotostelium fungivorum]